MLLKLSFVAFDYKDRWVFEDQNGKLWKGEYRYGNLEMLSSVDYNTLDGEPCDPMPEGYETEFDIIGMLNMHCGDCGVIDFCPSGECVNYAICNDSRFCFVKTEVFAKLADSAPLGEAPKRPCCFDSCNNEDCDSVREAQLMGLADAVHSLIVAEEKKP